MKLVRITWLDAVSDESGWKHLDKIRSQKPPVVRSVGWVIARTKTHVTLAASIYEDHGDGDVTIPLGMVRKEEELLVKK